MSGRPLPTLGSVTGAEGTRATPLERSARRPVRRVARLPMTARPDGGRALYRSTPYTPPSRIDTHEGKRKFIAAPAERFHDNNVGTLQPRQGKITTGRAGPKMAARAL